MAKQKKESAPAGGKKGGGGGGVGAPQKAEGAWVVDGQAEWQEHTAEQTGLTIRGGVASPAGESASFRSTRMTFENKRSARSLVFDPSPDWLNWEPVDNIGPSNLQDAPVFLSRGPDDYWIFGRYGPGKKRKGKAKQRTPKQEDGKPLAPEPATLDGFDVPLQTTPFPNQYDAPGGLKPGLGGYHAWQSRDLVHWVHHGPVTETFSRWVTTAEYADGKLYLYYDYPNDQDPHLYLDEDLTDGLPGKNMGIALRDPSDGSDCGVIRDKEGRFHIIFEDWSPIQASQRSWDSPLAGHAVSPNGIDNF